MKKYLAYIRGHHQILGFEEFQAALEAEEVVYNNTKIDDQISVFTTKDNPLPAARRCAFLHSLLGLILTGSIQENKLEIQKLESNFSIEKNSSFCVRAKRIGKKEIKQKSTEIERKLGEYILDRYDGYDLRVDFKNPDNRFIVIIIKNEFYLGKELWSKDRKQYHSREPSNRPNFRPGSMKTDFARALVNLSCVRKGEIFLDPFCGSGGILIEASHLGANCIGIDIDYNAVVSSMKNLRAFGESFYTILLCDSRHMTIKNAHAIATDPPYSIQSSTHGKQVVDLILEFLEEAETILLPGRRLVFSSPSKLHPENLIENTKFKIISQIDTRIHKSLTRRILVVK